MKADTQEYLESTINILLKEIDILVDHRNTIKGQINYRRSKLKYLQSIDHRQLRLLE
jgi:hypothetical protein